MTIETISKKLLEAEKIAVFTHINPDCDAFGSMCALAEGLKQLGKKVDTFVDGKLNPYEAEIFQDTKVCKVDPDPTKYDAFVAVDCAEKHRLGKYGDVFVSHENTFSVDHHFQRDEYSVSNHINPESASCCEIVYELLTKLKVQIDKKIATYIYAGIATDTNSFVNTNTTANSYKVAEKMFSLGADTIKINKQCFRTVSKESNALMKLFYRKMKFVGDKFAYVILTEKDFIRTNTSHLETANFSNLLCSIDGVKIGCCATQRNGKFSLSIRSTIDVSAEEFAHTLNGGGHPQAAGATIDEGVRTVEKILIKKARKFLRIRK